MDKSKKVAYIEELGKVTRKQWQKLIDLARKSRPWDYCRGNINLTNTLKD